MALRHSRWLHRLLHALRLPGFVVWWLRRFPRWKAFGKVRFRLFALDDWATVGEIFGDNIYAEFLAGRRIERVVDLGANRGYFTLRVAAHSLATEGGSDGFTTLLVEANCDLLPAIDENLRANNLNQATVVHGFVGPESAGEAAFHVAAFGISSSSYDTAEALPFEVPVKRIDSVPTVRLGPLLDEVFGPEERVDLLKVDIEGSEKELLLEHDAPWLSRVEAVIVEWHQWATTESAVVDRLKAEGFTEVRVLKSDAVGGLLACARS